ncbi:MAG: hypothetical protein KQH63_11395 [Desulfobulbaceae bacterium]|nr:hypothetical protein [Desulfobulbaceae bacterium]
MSDTSMSNPPGLERKINVFYIDNLPEHIGTSDVCGYFDKYFTIYSIIFNDKNTAVNIQSGWIMLEELDEDITAPETVKLLGKNLNIRLMGHLFPNRKS